MFDKIKEYVKNKQIFEEFDKVVVGISGGADSVCLLCVLLKLQKIYQLKIKAVHINHGLRGNEAKADEEFVETFCRERQVPLQIFNEDVKKRALEDRLSEEEAGRIVRRERFEQVSREWGDAKIALAHHQNDNVETMLLNIIRGTGLKGIGGILPVNGRYVRPMLCVKRQEVEAYLEGNEIPYCIDSTNMDDNYTRNRIRNHIVPYIEANINEGFVTRASEMMDQVRETERYICDQTQRSSARCTKVYTDSLVIEKVMWEIEPEIIRQRVIYQALCTAAGKAKDIESVHVKDTVKLFGNQVGKKLSLPYNLSAVRCYEGVRIQSIRNEAANDNEADELQVHMRVFKRESADCTFPENPYTKWFDYDIIKNTVEIRKRQTGDYITIDKQGHTQKIKKFFVNEKVSQELRGDILLAADGSHILWIVGYRQNPVYAVTQKTKQILEIEVYGGTESGRNY